MKTTSTLLVIILILVLAITGGVFLWGYKKAKDNKDVADIDPDKHKLSYDDDWYKTNAASLRGIISSGIYGEKLRNNFLRIYAKLKNIDDWEQLYNEFGTIRRDFLSKNGDLIFHTINQFSTKEQIKDLNSILEPRNIFVFSDRHHATTCEQLSAIKKWAPDSWSKELRKNRKFKKAAKKCNLL